MARPLRVAPFVASRRETAGAELLRNANLVVTGASGVLGSVLLRAVRGLSDSHGLDVALIGTGRSAQAAPATKDVCDHWVTWDVRTQPPGRLAVITANRPTYVIHAAATTTSQTMAHQPVDVFETLVAGTGRTLHWAHEAGVRRFVYVSSVEVFGRVSNGSAPVHEPDLGALDLGDPRSCYPMGKRAGELQAAMYRRQFGLDTLTVRPGQLIGAGVPIDDPRMPAAFCRAALSGSDIVLRSDGSSLVNYCDTKDAVRGILLSLVTTEHHTFNLVNPANRPSVLEFAHTVADVVGDGRVKVSLDPAPREATGFAAATQNHIAADRLLECGWRPTMSLTQSIQAMVGSWAHRDIAEC